MIAIATAIAVCSVAITLATVSLTPTAIAATIALTTGACVVASDPTEPTLFRKHDDDARRRSWNGRLPPAASWQCQIRRGDLSQK